MDIYIQGWSLAKATSPHWNQGRKSRFQKETHSYNSTRFPQIYSWNLEEMCYLQPIYCCLFWDNIVFMKAPHQDIIPCHEWAAGKYTLTQKCGENSSLNSWVFLSKRVKSYWECMDILAWMWMRPKKCPWYGELGSTLDNLNAVMNPCILSGETWPSSCCTGSSKYFIHFFTSLA